ncbi:MAG: hypothetical protein DRH70_07800 [Candidatus Coatesbacteria bacterium]|nr:MAG: hypothetical protein DRH70_07800 [Candidatus Coatesbacteria bacterium]
MRSKTVVWGVLFCFTFLLLHDFGAMAFAATGRPAGRINPKVPPGRRGIPSGLLAGSSMQGNPSRFTENLGFYVKQNEGERFKNLFTTSGRKGSESAIADK